MRFFKRAAPTCDPNPGTVYSSASSLQCAQSLRTKEAAPVPNAAQTVLSSGTSTRSQAVTQKELYLSLAYLSLRKKCISLQVQYAAFLQT